MAAGELRGRAGAEAEIERDGGDLEQERGRLDHDRGQLVDRAGVIEAAQGRVDPRALGVVGGLVDHRVGNASTAANADQPTAA